MIEAEDERDHIDIFLPREGTGPEPHLEEDAAISTMTIDASATASAIGIRRRARDGCPACAAAAMIV
ncbi:MAG: hypothetical protein DMF87_17440 [Acidobacteria bacterium]|nr:MAG: hypothetical protein DMF87_17440 [Acidobacteriota bacterium]